MNRDANVSDCGLYRFRLTRTWGESQPPLVFVMLNPSTADANVDDPTTRKCIGFAQRLGFGGVEVVNLFAWRSTDPSRLPYPRDIATDPVNDGAIREAVARRCVVLAWGANARRFPERAQHVERLVREHASVVRAIKLLRGGVPMHPLMAPYAAAKHMVALA